MERSWASRRVIVYRNQDGKNGGGQRDFSQTQYILHVLQSNSTRARAKGEWKRVWQGLGPGNTEFIIGPEVLHNGNPVPRNELQDLSLSVDSILQVPFTNGGTEWRNSVDPLPALLTIGISGYYYPESDSQLALNVEFGYAPVVNVFKYRPLGRHTVPLRSQKDNIPERITNLVQYFPSPQGEIRIAISASRIGTPPPSQIRLSLYVDRWVPIFRL